MLKQKKNFNNEELKTNTNTQNNEFQVYEPVKFGSVINNNQQSHNPGDDKSY